MMHDSMFVDYVILYMHACFSVFDLHNIWLHLVPYISIHDFVTVYWSPQNPVLLLSSNHQTASGLIIVMI